MTLVRLIHSGLATADLDLSISFYSEAFGFTVIFRENNITNEIEQMTGQKNLSCSLAQLSLPDSSHSIELLQFHGYESECGNEPIMPLRPGQGHIALTVKNFDSCIKKLVALNAHLLGDITEFPEGRAAYFREPSGTFFEISEASVPQRGNDAN